MRLPRLEYEIDDAQLADLPQIMEIERRSFESPWSKATFAEELLHGWSHLRVVRWRAPHPVPDGEGQGGRRRHSLLVGYILYWQVIDGVHILNLATHPEHRRHGLATLLLEDMSDFCRRRGYRIVTLEVRRSNWPAISFYRKHGFRAVGIRPNYYVQEREDAIVMIREP